MDIDITTRQGWEQVLVSMRYATNLDAEMLIAAIEVIDADTTRIQLELTNDFLRRYNGDGLSQPMLTLAAAAELVEHEEDETVKETVERLRMVVESRRRHKESLKSRA